MKAMKKMGRRNLGGIAPLNDPLLEGGARDIVDGMVAEGTAFLRQNRYRKNPYDPDSQKDQYEEEERRETEFREMASSVRQLRPLFDALASSMRTKFDGSPSETAKYRFGFLFSLMRATLDVAAIAGAPRLSKVLEKALHERMGAVRAAKPSREKVDAVIKNCCEQYLAARPNEASRSANNLAQSIESAVDSELNPKDKSGTPPPKIYHVGADAIAKRLRKIRTAVQPSG